MHFGPPKSSLSKKDSSDIEFDLPPVSVGELPLKKGRVTILMALFGFIGMALLAQVLYLQLVRVEEMSVQYEAVHIDREYVLPPRGLIYDRNGVPLAVNGPGKREHEFARRYPAGIAFSHALGFIGRVDAYHLSRDSHYIPSDFVGKMGIEKAYEIYLRGEHGIIEKNINVQEPINQPPLVYSPKPGNTLFLSIDSQMQKKLYEEIVNQVEAFKSPGGAGVVLDPYSGAVLALVSVPSFDNESITPALLDDPSEPLFNRAIAGEFPPGSTIKPFLGAAALEESIVTAQTVILDRGVLEVPSIYDPSVVWSFRGWKALGKVTMKRAIAMSSNIYFYIVGGGYKDIRGLGIETINHYLERFGWNEVTGIDISPEAKGFLPTPQWKEENIGEDWFIGDTYNSSIGQGFVRVTPLQLTLATSVLANRGILYQPYLVQQIKDENDNELFFRLPVATRSSIVSASSLKEAREGMREAVLSGTVWRLNDLPLSVAAKTGTAQAGQGRSPHGWVTGFAPYENPEVAFTILIQNGEGGEQSAVPAAKNFLSWYATRDSLD